MEDKNFESENKMFENNKSFMNPAFSADTDDEQTHENATKMVTKSDKNFDTNEFQMHRNSRGNFKNGTAAPNGNGNGNGNGNNMMTTTTTTTSMGAMSTQRIDFDDMLPLVGEFGKYQKILFAAMIPFTWFVAFVYFSQIFLTAVPEKHWCNVPELVDLPIDERMALSIPKINGEYATCEMYDVNYTQLLSQGIKVADPNWPKIPCRDGNEYNMTEIPYATVATEQNWVCENAALPTYAQSIFFLGAIFGGFVFGAVADRLGRIPALIGCNLMGCIFGIATAWANSFWLFALMRFFVGFAFDNCFTMIYILVLEYVGPKYRTFVANMSIAIFFTMASTALPWIAYYLANWRYLAIVTSAPLILVLLTPFIVPESARWLVSQGRISEAVMLLKKFEKMNGKEVPAGIYERFAESCQKMEQEENSQKNYSVLDLFKTPRLRRTTIFLVLIWMAISLVFDGHVRNVGGLGLDLFFTFTVANFTEFPANTLLTLTLDRWGRRWLACGTMVLSGVFSLFAIVVPFGVYSATLAIIGRFFVNISYNIGLQYAAEILPTVVRAQGVAFIHIMGYVASIIAPFVVYLGNFSRTLPLVILGILGIIGGLISLFLPETLHQDLPQTLNDGEEFGRGQSIWDFPCLNKKLDRDDDDDRSVNFTRSTQTGASLRSYSHGELGSSILRRSVNSSYATKL